MNKTVFESFDGFTRAYPIIIVFSSFINSIFNSTNEGYIFMVLLLVSNFFNHFLNQPYLLYLFFLKENNMIYF